jgi:CheY-like chemotaxis protein
VSGAGDALAPSLLIAETMRTPPAPSRPRVLAAPTRRATKPGPWSGAGPESKAPTLQGVRLLVVEDDPPSLRLLRAVLGAEGCDVRFATNAEDAFVLLQAFQPELMVIDLILPLMSGLLLAQQLKSRDATRDIPLVAVTAFNGHAAERMALDAGFSAYIKKPLDPAAFCEILCEMLGARR